MSKKPPNQIVVIEDDEDIRSILTYNLERKGYSVIPAKTGEEGIKLTRDNNPRLILLDLMLPGLNGFEVCTILKSDKKTTSIPIIMVTAKGEEEDIIKGLEAGADDYITKPFQLGEMIARIKAVLRRIGLKQSDVFNQEKLKVGEYVWYPKRAEIRVGNTPLILTVSEYKTLELMLSKPGWVFTRNQILNHIKGAESHSTERAMDVVVVGLRKKLKIFNQDIETVRGIGYRVNLYEE